MSLNWAARRTATAPQGGQSRPQPQHKVDPAPERLGELIAKYQSPGGYWVSRRILELAATETRPDQLGRPSSFTRHSTALRLSWLCFLNHVPEDICLDLMYTLWDGMEQPEQDPYPITLIDRMVQDTYRKGDPSNLKQAAPRRWSPDIWRAIEMPFEMPVIDPGDPERIRKLWDKGFAAIPVPSGDKGSSRNPKFAHLK